MRHAERATGAGAAVRRVRLRGGNWAVLRDPHSFDIRDRRRLQRYLLGLGPGPVAELDLDEVTALLLGSWSFGTPLPTSPTDLRSMHAADHESLSAAVRGELPHLQRAVHPAPGWRRRPARAPARKEKP